MQFFTWLHVLGIVKIYIKMHITKIYRWRHKILDYAQSTYVSCFPLTLKDQNVYCAQAWFQNPSSNSAGIKHIKLALT